MLWPKEFGQSGTASPASMPVTSPPVMRSRKTAVAATAPKSPSGAISRSSGGNAAPIAPPAAPTAAETRYRPPIHIAAVARSDPLPKRLPTMRRFTVAETSPTRRPRRQPAIGTKPIG